jgi:metal-responsive CopG/Arc/MetJ family transcriptional regulator
MKTTVTHIKKHEYEMAIKRSISMPSIMLDRALDKTRRRGFATFSDYIQDLIRKDTVEYATN